MLSLISWIILGLIAGALAKLLMPGDDKDGFWFTMLLGVAGAFAGGWLGSFAGMGTVGGLSLASIATATVGAFVLLFVYNKFFKK